MPTLIFFPKRCGAMSSYMKLSGNGHGPLHCNLRRPISAPFRGGRCRTCCAWHWREPLRSIALWSRINSLAADYGENVLGEQSLRIRFEHLCADPVPVIRRTFDFFGVHGADAQRIAQLEGVPLDSIGRWQRMCKDGKLLTE